MVTKKQRENFDKYGFNIWQPDTKTMLDGSDFYHLNSYGELKFIEMDNRCHTMHTATNEIMLRSTGAFDKNKKIIHEGDIVKIDIEGVNHWIAGEIAVIKWVPSRFQTVCMNGEKNMLRGEDSDVLEIIGNIYQNPELIKIEEEKVVEEECHHEILNREKDKCILCNEKIKVKKCK